MLSLHTEREATSPERPTLISPKPRIYTHTSTQEACCWQAEAAQVLTETEHTQISNPFKLYQKKISPKRQENLTWNTRRAPLAYGKHAEVLPAVKPICTHPTISGPAGLRNVPFQQGRKENFISAHLSRWLTWGNHEQLRLHTLPLLQSMVTLHTLLSEQQPDWLATANVRSPRACLVLALLSFWTVRQ